MSEKAIILSNFNLRYKHNLEDLLLVYGEIPISTKLLGIKLKDITLDHLTISFKHQELEFEILKPIPLQTRDNEAPYNWEEVKSTLRRMCKDAATKRGLSYLRLTKVEYPKSFFDIILIGIIVYNIVNLAVLKNFDWINKLIAAIWVPIHLVETAVFLVPRIQRYRIPIDSQMEWVFLVLLEGYPVIRIIDRLVGQEELNLDTLEKHSEYL